MENQIYIFTDISGKSRHPNKRNQSTRVGYSEYEFIDDRSDIATIVSPQKNPKVPSFILYANSSSIPLYQYPTNLLTYMKETQI